MRAAACCLCIGVYTAAACGSPHKTKGDTAEEAVVEVEEISWEGGDGLDDAVLGSEHGASRWPVKVLLWTALKKKKKRAFYDATILQYCVRVLL